MTLQQLKVLNRSTLTLMAARITTVLLQEL
jgi:hypothetical protein